MHYTPSRAFKTAVIATWIVASTLIFFNKMDARSLNVRNQKQNSAMAATAFDSAYFKKKLDTLNVKHSQFEKRVLNIRKILWDAIGNDSLSDMTIAKFEARTGISFMEFAKMYGALWKEHESLMAGMKAFREEYSPSGKVRVNISKKDAAAELLIGIEFNRLVMKIDMMRVVHEITGSICAYLNGQIDLKTMDKELGEKAAEMQRIKSTPLEINGEIGY